MSLSPAYTATGSVIVTATFNNNYCCCDVDYIGYSYLDVDTVMTIPGYTYEYPVEYTNAWLNETTVIAYADNTLVDSITNYIPNDDL